MIRVHQFLLIFLLLPGARQTQAQGVPFNREFAPTDAFVPSPEQPYREALCLNGTWKFLPVAEAQQWTGEELRHPQLPQNPVWEATPLKVPSPWNVNSFTGGGGGDFVAYPSYPISWQGARAGWLMRTFTPQASWKGKRLVLHFEAVAGFAQVYVNGKKVGEHFDLFLPFDIDITDAVRPGGENELLVWVAGAVLFDQPGKYGHRPYVGGSFWGQHIIGIWQDVYLVARPSVHIGDLFVKSFVNRDELEIEATVVNATAAARKVRLSAEVRPWQGRVGAAAAPEVQWSLGGAALSVPQSELTLPAGTSQKITLRVKPSGVLRLWTAETPHLYGVVLQLDGEKATLDRKYERFGWRQFSVVQDRFYLNGKPLVLKADSWHFMGIAQMTRRYAWAWYRMLRESHGNAVRLHAQPYPRFYLDMADEMGVYVLDETGIWASDGGPKVDAEAYWQRCSDHLQRLVLRDRNHPSVLGWSVCNENLPVVMHVQRAPDSLVRRQVAEINRWVELVRSLDPTRSWISGDGETNLPTDLPVVIGHYGHEKEIRRWAAQGRVWGIGEQGMAYAGTPRQVARFNGDRAYESQLGRMEGLAAEAVDLLNLQKKFGASFTSIFNVVWYGLKPLALGLPDTTRPPAPSDGVFFPAFREGVGGVQPERLGPYTTTLNPGYDPRLPLFEPWPLYEAVRQSFRDSSQLPLPPLHPVAGGVAPLPAAPQATVVLLSADPDSVLAGILHSLGVAVRPAPLRGEPALLILDGRHPPSHRAALQRHHQVLQAGGTVLVWGVDPRALAVLNRYLSHPLQLSARPASSFLTRGSSPLLSGLGHGDFYFSELSGEMAMNYALAGEWVRQGRVLLEAPQTEWKTWNHQPEYIKTAAVLRSERERKAAGTALVECRQGNGKVYVMSLEPPVLYRSSVPLLRRLLMNLGVVFTNTGSGHTAALSPSGVLEHALLLGAYDAPGKTVTEMAALHPLQGVASKNFFTGSVVQHRFWEPVKAREGVFDLGRAGMAGPAENAVAYLSFWVYSPRSLTNLLLEPDLPRLDLLIGADDAHQVYLNGQLLGASLREGGLRRREQTLSALPLEKGWNHFLVKVIQKGGDWKVALELASDKEAFLGELRSQVAPPF